MPWTRERKIFSVTTYLETKSFETLQAIFHRKFNFNNYPQKNQIHCWVHKFQVMGPVKKLKKKEENPRSGRKLTRCPDCGCGERFCRKESKKTLRRRSQELGLSCAQ